MILSIFLLNIILIYAHLDCATDKFVSKLQNDTKIQKRIKRIEKATKNYINNIKSNKIKSKRFLLDEDTIINIPIVWHILYFSNDENLSETQLESQISILNKDFTAINNDIDDVPNEWTDIIGNFQINFYTHTIIRKSTSTEEWGTNNNNIKYNSTGGSNSVNGEHYLNVWIGNIGGSILGYAFLPGVSFDIDGIVVSPGYIGDTGYLESSNYDRGRVLTHEIGHYLNLKHPWGSITGECSEDDNVDDTPIQKQENFGCPSYPTSSCGSNDMTNNYMDYSYDHCKNMFTENQVLRGRALFDIGGGGFRQGIIYPNCEVNSYFWIGDGYCDKTGNYNTEDCGWDGGDCCEDNCQDGVNACGVNGYECFSSSPTLSPTSAPTYFGETRHPTRSPTPSPTYADEPTLENDLEWYEEIWENIKDYWKFYLIIPIVLILFIFIFICMNRFNSEPEVQFQPGQIV